MWRFFVWVLKSLVCFFFTFLVFGWKSFDERLSLQDGWQETGSSRRFRRVCRLVNSIFPIKRTSIRMLERSESFSMGLDSCQNMQLDKVVHTVEKKCSICFYVWQVFFDFLRWITVKSASQAFITEKSACTDCRWRDQALMNSL